MYSSSNYWCDMQTVENIDKIKINDQIVLTDKQTIEELIEDGIENATEGLFLEVLNIRNVNEADGLANWTFVELAGYKIPLTLVIKTASKNVDFGIYYQPDDIENGNRQDQLSQDNFWIFEEPGDSEDFVPSELKMARKFDQEIEGVGKVDFEIKIETLYGEINDQSDGETQFVSITEYRTVKNYDKIENPEIIILEIGGLNNDGDLINEGGLISVLQGANISQNDLSLTPI